MMGDKFEYSFDNEYITVSGKNERMFYLHNYKQDIKLRNDAKITAEMMPDIDDINQASSLTGFYFYFDYGDETSDIVSGKDSDNIKMSPLGDCKWTISKAKSHTVGFYWKLCPPETMIMEKGTGLSIYISNINCNSEIGMTDLHIRTTDGQPDGRCNLIKVGKPFISYFNGPSDEYDVGDKIKLSWDVENPGGSCEVTLNNVPVGKTDETEITAKVNDKYILVAKNKAGYTVSGTYDTQFKFIESLQVEKADSEKKTVTISWSTKNCDRCWINGYKDNLDFFGTAEYPLSKERQTAVRLFVTKKGTTDTYSEVLTYTTPAITEFSAWHSGIFGWGNQVEQLLTIKGENDFIMLEELQKNDAYPCVNAPPYGTIDPPSDPPENYPMILAKWSTDLAEYVTTSLEGDSVHHDPNGSVSVTCTWTLPVEVTLNAFDKYGCKVSVATRVMKM